MKKTLAIWGDSSSESKKSECPNDASILVVQDDVDIFDGLFVLMEKLDDEDNEEKITFPRR